MEKILISNQYGDKNQREWSGKIEMEKSIWYKEIIVPFLKDFPTTVKKVQGQIDEFLFLCNRVCRKFLDIAITCRDDKNMKILSG